MHKNFNLLTVQNELGYTFKDPEYIITAFTHRSYEAKGKENNVGLVFLGKQLLSFVLCDYITSRLPYTDEKQLAYQTECYLSALGTEKFIKQHRLTDFVMLSEINEPMRESNVLGKEIFYAISAAIYRDGGLPSLKSFLMPMIRACGGDDHYTPSLHGHVHTAVESDSSDGTHIKSERLRRPQKSGSIGFSKAETLTAEQEPSAKEKKKSDKAEKAEKAEKKSKHDKTEKSEKRKKNAKDEPIYEITEDVEHSAPIRQKTFIRDPFAPVRLSDDLRNYKPKKPSKYDTDVDPARRSGSESPFGGDSAAAHDPKPLKESTSPSFTEARTQKTSAPTPFTESKDAKAADEADKNGKSLLQEFVQKNLRTANVLLKYKLTPNGRGIFTAEATLDGRVIGTATAQNKKDAEKDAATAAYRALKDKSSAEHKWFFSLSCSDVTAPDTSSDYVSKINQYFQQKMRLSNAPIAYEKRPSADRRQFVIAAVYEGKEIGIGKAASLKDAKQLAAKEACKKLGI